MPEPHARDAARAQRPGSGPHVTKPTQHHRRSTPADTLAPLITTYLGVPVRTRTTAAAVATLLVAVLVGCSSADSDGASDKAAASASSSTPSVSAKDLAEAREAAGLPPSPGPTARTAYIDGLNAIDRDIVHGKDDKAVSRGINTCSTIKSSPGDEAKQIKLTGQRFTSPTHPEGRDAATSAKILALAHKNICPDF